MNRRQFALALPIAGMALAQTVPSSAQQSSSATRGLLGHWVGALSFPDGSSPRLAFDLTKTTDGILLGAITLVDQGNQRVRADVVRIDGDSLHLELNALRAVYEGRLSGADNITGTWTQGRGGVPLELTRSAVQPASTPTGPPAARGLALDIQIPIAPTPFPAAGKTHLVYELHITDYGRTPEQLIKRIEVLDGDTVLASYEGMDLIRVLGRVGASGDDERLLARGGSAIAYLWVTLTTRVPTALRHRVIVGETTLETEPTHVSQSRVPQLASPLRGAGWVALNGPSNTSGHRRALIAAVGRARIAQRFAIDWLKRGATGRPFEGNPRDNRSYFAYGSDVLAVADAVVARTKDGIPENVPGPGERAVPITNETVAGNHIVLDLGGSQFALYAHLQPGALKVKQGDRVKRGQALGLLGNSGNSTGPHLHFHVCDSNPEVSLASEGLPYVLTAWHKELPLENDSIDFG